MLKVSRKIWSTEFDDSIYTSWVGSKIRQYELNFRVRNLKGGKIDFQISPNDLDIIMNERRNFENAKR